MGRLRPYLIGLVVLLAGLSACDTAEPPPPPLSQAKPLITAPATFSPISPIIPTATLPPALTEPTATATPLIPSPPPQAEDGQAYAVVNVAANDSLNLRAGPGVGSEVVGTIPYSGLNVYRTGPEREVAGSLWVSVRYGDLSGWINSRYLARQVGQADEAAASAAAARAAAIILALEQQDMAALASFVHPDQGMRFSPYPYIEAGDLVFSPAQVGGLLSDPTVYHWGVFDGSGDPIDLTFAAYFAKFVYDVDFAQPQTIGYNQVVSSGNMINNMAQVYPGATIIEYHFDGFDPQYGGLDWRSLHLILEAEAGVWYLVGLVHGQWTT